MTVGIVEGRFEDPTRRNWDDTEPRPITWVAWYPAQEGSPQTEILAGPPAAPWFTLGPAARDAPLRAGPKRFPVILLSHGTGGSALSLGWLGRRLAAEGLVVLAPNHHGNHALEPYHAAGFVCWWERARDLSLLFDRLAASGPFASRLATEQAGVCGFSLGTHTALALLGAETDMLRFRNWSVGKASGRGPSNFSDLADHIPGLFETSSVFRESFARHAASYRDARITAALLLAPAPPVRSLTEQSLRAIAAPVGLMVGAADTEAPPADGALWLAGLLPAATVDMLLPEAGHMVFLPETTPAGRSAAPHLCTDAPGIDRRQVHETVAATAARLFGCG
jgi:predicted dienelactone hydrolase